MAYVCDNHPDTPGVLLITNLDSGDTVVLCGDDIYPWASAIATALAPEPEPEPAQAAVDEHTGDVTDEDDAEPTSPGPDPTPAASPDPTPADPAPETGDGDGDGFSDETIARALADPTGPEANQVLAGSPAATGS